MFLLLARPLFLCLEGQPQRGLQRTAPTPNGKEDSILRGQHVLSPSSPMSTSYDHDHLT